jgi:hypothetical protein
MLNDDDYHLVMHPRSVVSCQLSVMSSASITNYGCCAYYELVCMYRLD